jgi:hypothetical protein
MWLIHGAYSGIVAGLSLRHDSLRASCTRGGASTALLLPFTLPPSTLTTLKFVCYWINRDNPEEGWTYLSRIANPRGLLNNAFAQPRYHHSTSLLLSTMNTSTHLPIPLDGQTSLLGRDSQASSRVASPMPARSSKSSMSGAYNRFPSLSLPPSSPIPNHVNPANLKAQSVQPLHRLPALKFPTLAVHNDAVGAPFKVLSMRADESPSPHHYTPFAKRPRTINAAPDSTLSSWNDMYLSDSAQFLSGVASSAPVHSTPAGPDSKRRQSSSTPSWPSSMFPSHTTSPVQFSTSFQIDRASSRPATPARPRSRRKDYENPRSESSDSQLETSSSTFSVISPSSSTPVLKKRLRSRGARGSATPSRTFRLTRSRRAKAGINSKSTANNALSEDEDDATERSYVHQKYKNKLPIITESEGYRKEREARIAYFKELDEWQFSVENVYVV